ncbi:EAL domain-containing protein [Rhodoferax sp.]|uniref:bifunctional diguanylate cyclase/phosphodiesterase n=1 Tax=Rhodoferax sp. TaxID=50421 RepID=UPI0034514774
MPSTGTLGAGQFQQLAQLAAQLCAAASASLTQVYQGTHSLVAHTGPSEWPLAQLQHVAEQLAPTSEPQVLPSDSLGLCVATPVWSADAGCIAVLWVMWTQDPPHLLDAVQRTALTSLATQIQLLLQLQASEQQYRALFEGNPLPMWVQQLHSQRIVAVNSAAVAHYGYSQAEFLTPTNCAENPTDADTEATLLGDSTHSLLHRHRRHRRADGSVIDVEMSTSTVQFNGQAARMVMVNDITARLRAERSLARLGRAQRMLSACNEALVRASSESALLHEVCRITVEIGGYKNAWVGFAEHDDAKSIRLVAGVGDIDPDMKQWPFSWSATSRFGQGPSGRCLRSGEVVLVPDMRQDPSLQLWLARYPSATPLSIVCLPLRNASGTYGLFCLTATETLEAGADELPLLQQLANDIAFGIDHLRTQQAQRLADTQIHHQASLLDKAQDAIVVRSIDHRILFWNKSAERLYGWTAIEVLGRSMVEHIYTASPQAFATASQCVLEQGEWHGEITQNRKDGSQMVIEARWTLVRDAQDQPHSIMAVNTDITQRKATEREVQKLAFYDPLTNLPNRQLLLDRLGHALATSARNGQGGALLFIDLDNFKTLNDTLGHDKGDLLLQQVALRLAACVRSADTVARLGGDEFVVMLEDLGPDPRAAGVKAKHIGEKILAALSMPYTLAGHEYQSTSSIGIAPFSHQPDTVGELLKQADIAMYQAKGAGRNTLGFFDPQLQAEVTARAALEADLRQAVAQDEFFLHYQSQHNAQGGMTGVEALVRWRHPQRGLVSPAAFIPLAEETGLILELGRLVLAKACSLLADWGQGVDTQHLTMAVNVSSRQFKHADFVQQVMDTLAETGANPRQLKLELTESLLVDDIAQVIAKMEALQAQGVGFSLNDFGTSYSSLSYLKRLPLDQLKIDQSFVCDVMTDPNDAVIARTIIGLGQSLGLNVIAEGVETAEQRDFLAQHGCQAFQGYFFARPLPADQLAQSMGLPGIP